MVAVKAHYDGKVIVLDEPVKLSKGQPLVVHIEVSEKRLAPKRSRKKQKKKSACNG
jgi:hypothetical protein